MIELVSNLFLKETGINNKLDLQCQDKNGIMGSVMLLKEKEVEAPSYLFALAMNLLIIRSIRHAVTEKHLDWFKNQLEEMNAHHLSLHEQEGMNSLYIQQSIDEDCPVILSFIKGKRTHYLLVIGYELDEQNILKRLFCLDSQAKDPSNSYWNAYLDLQTDGLADMSKCFYSTRKTQVTIKGILKIVKRV